MSHESDVCSQLCLFSRISESALFAVYAYSYITTHCIYENTVHVILSLPSSSKPGKQLNIIDTVETISQLILVFRVSSSLNEDFLISIEIYNLGTSFMDCVCNTTMKLWKSLIVAANPILCLIVLIHVGNGGKKWLHHLDFNISIWFVSSP